MNELSDADLKAIPAKTVWQDAPEGIHTALDVIHRLKEVYTQTLAYEFSHIQDSEERAWLHQMVESIHCVNHYQIKTNCSFKKTLNSC